MSRVPRSGSNGSGGYTNGYGSYGRAGENDYDEPRRPSADRPSGERRRERRPGGYGVFSEDREDDRRPGGYGGYGGFAAPQEEPVERRPGGYGGYGGFQRQDEVAQVTRPTSLERTQARRRSGERNARGDTSRSQSRPGDGGNRAGTQQMEGMYTTVSLDYTFIADSIQRCLNTSTKTLTS